MAQINLVSIKFLWTKHSKEKLRFYNLSESRIMRVFRHPGRVEAGVAPNTLAAMQTAGSSKHPYEIWLMYQINYDVVKIISGWRYPGVTKPGDKVPVPADILAELESLA